MFKKILAIVVDWLKPMDNTMPDTHKQCPHCEGMGSEDFFGKCDVCDGKGMVNKTYKELHNLPDYNN